MDQNRLSNVQGSQQEQHEERIPFLAERLVRAKIAEAIVRRCAGWHRSILAGMFVDDVREKVVALLQQELRAISDDVLHAPNGPVLTAMTHTDGAIVDRICDFQLAKVGPRVLCLACERDVLPGDQVIYGSK